MSIVFYDIEEWEKDRVPAVIAGLDVVCDEEILSANNVELARDAEAISVFAWSVLSRELLEKMPKLKCIATRSTGFDHIDLEYCKEHDIAVFNVPGYGERTVAEHTFALMLALSRNILHGGDRTRQGSFSREGLRGFDLEGKILGLIGVGKIGSKVAEIAKAFAMKVIALDPKPDESLDISYLDSLKDLLGQADVISLHAPLTEETKHLINMESIGYIKPGALLINTARGDLIQTAALLKALDGGILYGAGLDVIENERMVGEEAEVLSKSGGTNEELAAMLHNHILLSNPKVLITPHNAFNSEEALGKLLNTTVYNIESFFKGETGNIVLKK